MAESTGLPCPKMDWSNSDRPQAYQEFEQIANIWHKIKNIKESEQHNYIILWSGNEGPRMFNTWRLTDDELKDQKNVWEKFATQIEPTENFRIHRLELQRFRQSENESVDEFCTRCKAKVLKCKFKDNSAEEERMIEVLISGIKYSQIQKK